MGATLAVIKTLIVPALISLIIYLASTYLLLPLWHRYRLRSHYVALAPSLDALSSRTSSIRARVQDRLGRFIYRRTGGRLGIEDDDDDDGGDEESLDGEEMGVVNDDGVDGHHGRDRGRYGRDGVLGIRPGRPEVRRLSRDLEEGFMDDSDEEDEGREAPR